MWACVCTHADDVTYSIFTVHFRPGKRKPRKRIRKFILELSGNQSLEFGQKIGDFITDMRSRSTEPHQKMLLEVCYGDVHASDV